MIELSKMASRKRHVCKFAVLAFAVLILGAATIAGGASISAHAIVYNDIDLRYANISANIVSGLLWRNDKITLTLTGEGTENSELYYTTDGTAPTKESNKCTKTGSNTFEYRLPEYSETTVFRVKVVAIKGEYTSKVFEFVYECLYDLVGRSGTTIHLVNGEPQASFDNSLWVCNANGKPTAEATWEASAIASDLATMGATHQFQNKADGSTYIQLDLGQETTLNRFWVQSGGFPTTNLTNLEIKTSADGDEFTSVYKKEGAIPRNGSSTGWLPWAQVPDHTFTDIKIDTPVTARYVRYYAGPIGGAQPFSKVKVFNDTIDPRPEYPAPEEIFDSSVPISKGKKYELIDGKLWTAAGETSLVKNPGNGKPRTLEEWYAKLGAPDLQGTGNSSLYFNNEDRSTRVLVDLGKVYLVNRTIVHNYADAPATYNSNKDIKMNYSEDGETWNVFCDLPGETELNKSRNGLRYWELTLKTPVKARYLTLQLGSPDSQQFLTNWLVYGNLNEEGFWTKPGDITVNYDSIKKANDILSDLTEKYPTINFTSSNGYVRNYAIEWTGEYTDDDLKAGGAFTFYGSLVEGQEYPELVKDTFNAALVATVNLTKPDLTALNALLDTISGLSDADYTTVSWNALQAAVTAAQAIKDDIYSTGAQIAGALKNLQDKYDALDALANKEALSAKITEVEGVEKGNYTGGSYKAFTDALTQAKALMSDEQAGQSQVDAALEALTDAHNALLDKTTLTNLLEAIEENTVDGSEETKYTPASWQNYQDALTAANDAKENAATLEAADAAAAALKEAKESLTLRGNKTELAKLIAENENKRESDYTVNSFAAFSDALKNAKAVNADVNATQNQINAAIFALTKKAEALKEVGDKTELKELIDKYVQRELYTTASYAEFESTLVTARNTYEDGESSKAEIEKAVADLKKAAELLVLRGDKTELEALLQSIDPNNYTRLSAIEYLKAREAALTVMESVDALPAEVQAAYEALQAAIAKLVALGDKTALAAKIAEIEKRDGLSKKLQEALDEARAVNADTQATQADVDAALSKLNAAAKGGCGGSIASDGSLVFAVVALILCAITVAVKTKRIGKEEK